MNFKLNLQGVDVQINEESSVKVEKLDIEYTDIKLNEVPAIISAFKGLFAEINQQMNPSCGATPKVYNADACDHSHLFQSAPDTVEKNSDLFED